MAEDAIATHQRVVLDTLSAHFQPVRRGEVNGLGEVVAVVEAGMVAAGKRDHELSGALVGAMNRDAVSLEQKQG